MAVTIKAKGRNEFTSSAKREIREQGLVPAVIYGKKVDSQSIAVDSIELLKTLRDEGRNAILHIEVDGKTHPVMMTDMQRDPLKNELVHADFLVVDMGAETEVTVPVNLTGDAQGVKDGGVLQQAIHELSVKAKPADIPQTIDVDITSLDVNETITVKDVKVTGNYSITQEEDEVIASILPPRQEEEIDSGEEQEPGQPENEEGREEA
ncbi:50S ribosomal protein L25/general stress protein Ctc [Bacillus lacus]|uniref:Large ribosomal subunit protein bL25 n=1 Tax=Metabacillus lacus TaxID=1983721 RepID=A0A7X2J092_9BACI|nr:50S ribosomal protein L25/general stress protein Ctc [Metabacillus lacus]MRX72956.1 50S ribosomal protein L25/general stress protein Ctc [Metabacillus lacus]